jgi:hypothetical protein
MKGFQLRKENKEGRKAGKTLGKQRFDGTGARHLPGE